MCGVFGYVGDFNKDIMRKLFLIHQTRGSDASGYAYRKNENLVWAKKDIPASSFVKCKVWKNLERERPNIMICHTRAATSGDKSNSKNNHPFIDKEKCIALIHNGIISNHISLQMSMNLKVDGDCDSEVILALLKKYIIETKMDIVESVTKTVNELSGSYNFAFIFGKKLYVYSDGSIDLVKYGNTIYFLQCGNDILSQKDGIFNIISGRELYSKQLAIMEIVDGVASIEIRKIKVKEKSYTYGSYSNYGSYISKQNRAWFMDKEIPELKLDEKEKKEEVIPIVNGNINDLEYGTSKYCAYLGGMCATPECCIKCELRGSYIKDYSANDYD